MDNPFAALLVGLAGLWWIFVLIVAFTFGVAWPLMAWSATRNIKQIRQQLERLNDNLESERWTPPAPTRLV